MSLPLEDYALLGDMQTAALVSRQGSIDWLCLPRFDSPACFAALLGAEEHGRWLLAPAEGEPQTERRYRADSLVLETTHRTAGGAVRVLDLMPPRGEAPDVVRLVEGLSGRVAMRSELAVRFDYGSIVPWTRAAADGRLTLSGGPDAVSLRAPVEHRARDERLVAEFEVGAGERVELVLTWYPSHREPPAPVDAARALAETEAWWERWAARCSYDGPWKPQVVRSLVVLKALTYAPTGGIVAAPTTSLPELLGGVRNWDYRYCWLRDSTFTLDALLDAGYLDEAAAWRDWLLRAIAGDPADLQIMYGPRGERRLTEETLGWLPGYEGSSPVRAGNAASRQRQLDVYGEVVDTLYQARRLGLEANDEAWELQRALLEHLATTWDEPGQGIWESRGEPRHYTYGKVMAWVAFDRAVRALEAQGLDGARERWAATRDEIRAEVCRRGYDAELGSFVQHYGSREPDAALLLLPLVGFLPASDPRIEGTVRAVERRLTREGLVYRYRTEGGEGSVDGLPPGEGAFLPCSFWLADNLVLQGRREEAEALFERLLGLANDVGLLAEEYDPDAGRLLGNFPQAFTHVGLVNTALWLARNGT